MKRSYVVFYFFTALAELDHLFSLPQDQAPDGSGFAIPQSPTSGLHLTCSGVTWASPSWSIPNELNFEALPGETCALVCPTESTRHRVSLTLGGLEPPVTGVIRYNGIDLRSVSLDAINEKRGMVFGRDLRLLEGTVADNIIMGRPGLESEDLLWTLNFVQLDKEIDDLPSGLQTVVEENGKNFTPSQQLRMLLARAIITHPSLVILDGALHEIPTDIRESILHHLCAKEVPWTLVIVTTDPNIKSYVQKCLTLS